MAKKPSLKERFVNLYNQIRDYYTGATCEMGRGDVITLHFEQEGVRLGFFRSGDRQIVEEP